MYDDGSAHGTYLEDFVLSLEMLPNQFRRDLELLKELDRETYDLSKETQQLEKQYIENLSKFSSLQDKLEKDKIIEVNQKIKNDINVLKDRIQKKLSNKSAIAQSLIDVIDQFGNKLDSDLVLFENELKGAGDYEAPRGIPSDSEVGHIVIFIEIFYFIFTFYIFS
jgi:seryl-tRNA synthetase